MVGWEVIFKKEDVSCAKSFFYIKNKLLHILHDLAVDQRKIFYKNKMFYDNTKKIEGDASRGECDDKETKMKMN